ncbi:uncharacterized protein LOC108679320 isoform X5 [Hyalella azteca]|uniref:Uncharacterized protein LOC108679320 isoform X5 n=1 Tax=Hyalella azteca TaxID=294128 RepID=A0A8B7PDR1_HYAAZ|nr:uncharacterized protein LOC108679320 isoform X5 [Hyalella azteca]
MSTVATSPTDQSLQPSTEPFTPCTAKNVASQNDLEMPHQNPNIALNESESDPHSNVADNSSPVIVSKRNSPIVDLIVENEIEIVGRDSLSSNAKENPSDALASGVGCDSLVSNADGAQFNCLITAGCGNDGLLDCSARSAGAKIETDVDSSLVRKTETETRNRINVKSFDISKSELNNGPVFTDTSDASQRSEGHDASDIAGENSPCNSSGDSSSHITNNPCSDPSSLGDTSESVSASCEADNDDNDNLVSFPCNLSVPLDAELIETAHEHAIHEDNPSASVVITDSKLLNSLPVCLNTSPLNPQEKQGDKCVFQEQSENDDEEKKPQVQQVVDEGKCLETSHVNNDQECFLFISLENDDAKCIPQVELDKTSEKPVGTSNSSNIGPSLRCSDSLPQVKHERDSFRNRIGSLRKNKNIKKDFIVEIFESKKPTFDVSKDGEKGAIDSADFTNLLVGKLRTEGRARSEPPELTTSAPNFVCFEISHSNSSNDVSAGARCSNIPKPTLRHKHAACDSVQKLGCNGTTKSGSGPTLVQSCESGLIAPASLSHTWESASGISGDLTSTESPRKDSDPDISAEVPPILTGTTPAAGQASSPSGADVKSLSEAVGGEDDTEGAGGAGNSGDAASSTGSEGRRAATAFTIELDKEDDGEGSAKKLDIAGPLSKWAPKHRRNLSLTKVEENKVVMNFFDENGNSRARRRSSTMSRLEKVEERGGKPPVYRARSGTLGVGGGACNPGAGGVLLRKVGGYHSEGYFSSDQDEDAPRKTDVKSPRSPRTPDAAKSPVVVTLANGVPKSPSQDFSRASSSSLRGRPASPDLGAARRTSAATITLNESANFLIEKMINSTPETKRKSSVGSRPGDSARTCCKGLDKKPSVADITGRSSRSSSEKGSKGSSKMDGRKQEDSTHTNCQPFKIDRLADDMAREEDEVSEAGTYTIDKESSPDADKPQADIEGAFRHAALAEEATAYGSANTPLWDTAEMNSGISRSSPNWIQQWAAQVAEQTSGGDLSDPSKCNELPTLKSSHTSTRLGKTSHLPSAVGSSADNDHLRPRRKLPTPPSLMQQSYPSSAARSNELAELEALAKTRLMSLCDEADREALQVLQDTETRSYLRDTEHLLTSLQARVTDNTPITSSGGYRIASFESHDSGGDSDVDTSTSFALQEDRTPALRSKLKLSGLDSSSKGFGAALNNSRTSKVDPVVSSHLKRERSIVSEGGYAKSLLPCTVTNPMSKSLCLVGCTNSEALCQGSCLMTKSLTEEIPNSEALGQLNCTITKLPGQASCTERDSTSFTAEKSELSDSSSETSMKTQRKTMNNPPLKYNRAFSLRRARLGADDVHNARQAPLTPTERRKQTSPLLRSSSAAAVPRKTPHVRSTGGATVPSSLQQGVSKSPSRSSINKKDFASNKKATGLSRPGAAALSTKEVDFQNWKRRKNYDPMKAAKDGRQKQLEKRNTEKITNDNITSSDRGSPSPPGSLLRSASFHGTEAMLGGGSRWPRLPQSSYIPPNTYTSEDDGPMSYDEESAVNCLPRSSPLRRSPTSPHQLSQSPHASSPSHSAAAARRRRSSYAHSDDSEHVLSSPSRKMTVEETGSEGKRSPLSVGGGMTSSAGSRGAALPSNSGRNRAKIEALDNLVISTIHSLSNKVRGTSENLLQKLKTQYGEEDRDRADLLQNVLNHLNSESESASSQIRSTSKDLSGILKNLKKIQTALEVIDQVMVEGGGDYDDLEDIDWPPNAAGSDY